MSRVLLLCPTRRDRREIALLSGPFEFVFHDYATVALEDMLIEHRQAADVRDPLRECDDLTARLADAAIDAVVSTDDYPGSTLACIVARVLGLPGPDPAVNLLCQHKHQCRIAQHRFVPEAVPAFASVDTAGAFTPPSGFALPAFVKPIKSFFSIGAQRLEAWGELAPIRAWWGERDDFFRPFDRMLEKFTPFSVGTRRLLLESLLVGEQVTLEGYAYNGDVGVFGIVDSVMFPGTIVFQRFDYPSVLPDGVQARMADIAKRLMRGIGFDNGLFNIEMMYDVAHDRIGIIEINPRMASQFGDLYEKVDGFNSYAVMLDIAHGRAPHVPHRQGRHRTAASCVLRKFTDQEIAAVPSEAEIEALRADYPDIRVEHTGAVGERLSDTMQDGHSFRYGLIHLGGRDLQDIRTALQDCERRLTFGLVPVTAQRAAATA